MSTIECSLNGGETRVSQLVVAPQLVIRPFDVLNWLGVRAWEAGEPGPVDVGFLAHTKACPVELAIETAVTAALRALRLNHSTAVVRYVGSVRVFREIALGEVIRPVAAIRYASRCGGDSVHLTLGLELLRDCGALLATAVAGVEVSQEDVDADDRTQDAA